MHAHVNKSMLWLPQYNLISFLANLSLFKLVYSVQVEMGFEPRTVSLQDMKIITGATVFFGSLTFVAQDCLHLCHTCKSYV